MEYSQLDDNTRVILDAYMEGELVAPGPAQRFIDSMPPVDGCYEDVYLGFIECDREPWSGALQFSAMNAVIDRYGIHDLDEFEIRRTWAAMAAASRKRGEELKPAERAERGDDTDG